MRKPDVVAFCVIGVFGAACIWVLCVVMANDARRLDCDAVCAPYAAKAQHGTRCYCDLSTVVREAHQ